jgi:hypothetical protein
MSIPAHPGKRAGCSFGEIRRTLIFRSQRNIEIGNLFLFNGYFGRLNDREDLITLFKIHSVD